MRFNASCCRSFVVVILVSSAATISIMSPIGISLMSYFIWDSGGSFKRPGPLPVTRSARASDWMWARSWTRIVVCCVGASTWPSLDAGESGAAHCGKLSLAGEGMELAAEECSWAEVGDLPCTTTVDADDATAVEEDEEGVATPARWCEVSMCADEATAASSWGRAAAELETLGDDESGGVGKREAPCWSCACFASAQAAAGLGWSVVGVARWRCEGSGWRDDVGAGGLEDDGGCWWRYDEEGASRGRLEERSDCGWCDCCCGCCDWNTMLWRNREGSDAKSPITVAMVHDFG